MKRIFAILVLLGMTALLSADILIPGAFNRPHPRPRPQQPQPVPLDIQEWQKQYKRLQLAVLFMHNVLDTLQLHLAHRQYDKAQLPMTEILHHRQNAVAAIAALERIEKVNHDIPENQRQQFQKLKQELTLLQEWEGELRRQLEQQVQKPKQDVKAPAQDILPPVPVQPAAPASAAPAQPPQK